MKKYKEFFKNVKLSDSEFEEIKNNIINKRKPKNFKLRYACIIVLVIFIAFVGVVSANKIINHMKIDVNEEKSFKKITFENVLDKDYDSALFEDGNYYTYDEIEEKLGFKILKSDYYDSDLFKLNKLEVVDGKIASAIFTMVNNDKSDKSPFDSNISFSLKTKNATKESDFWISGNSYLDKYFIKSLDVEASIIYLDNPSTYAYIHFVYNNVFYTVAVPNYHDFTSYDDLVNTSKEKLDKKINEILESLTLE